MKFSVIVPIYNVDKYLRECVDSILNQSYTNFELILVDDGSPDESPLICDEYAKKDSRIIVLHKINGGLVSARIAGVKIASGEYAVCVDGDDFLHKDCLKNIHGILCNNGDIDLVCFGFNLYREDNVITKPIICERYGFYNYNQIKDSIYPMLFYSRSSQRFPHQICGKAIRMELYKQFQLRVPCDISMAEDGACMHPLLANVKSLYIENACLYYYRQVMSSMTKVRKPLDWDNYDKVFAIYEKEVDLDKSDFRMQYYRLRTHNLFNITISQFYSEEPYRKIVNKILERFKKHPEYDVAINNSDFALIPFKLIRVLLKYRCFIIAKLYSISKFYFK